jgi:hypothetical protein
VPRSARPTLGREFRDPRETHFGFVPIIRKIGERGSKPNQLVCPLLVNPCVDSFVD